MFNALRAALLFLVAYALSTAAALLVVSLPDDPGLRYAALALPIIAAVMVMTVWWDGRAFRMEPSPRVESPPTEDLARLDPVA